MHGRRLAPAASTHADASSENPVLTLGVGGFLLGILGVIGGHITLFKGLDEMQQLPVRRLALMITLLIAVDRLRAVDTLPPPAVFAAGVFFPLCSVGVAIGLMLHARSPCRRRQPSRFPALSSA